MLDITVIILTKNESLHIERVLLNATSFARRVIVVDSFSTDATVDIAKKFDIVIFQRKFVSQSDQFQWALDNCQVDTDWIMRLDADELLGADLIENLSSTLPKLGQDVVGISLNRRHIFWGKWIRFGGRYPLKLLRIWRNGQGRVEDRWMDEHIVVWGGRTILVKGEFADHNLNDLTFFIDKHNSYATREALDVLIKKYGLSGSSNANLLLCGSRQAAAKRVFKESIYNRVPFSIASMFYFTYRYIFQFGFLDGRAGLVYHFLQGYWYRFLVGAKVAEFERQIGDSREPSVMKARLESITGYKLR